MADLLSHVLVPYTVLTVASWWLSWVSKRWIVIGMAGAAIPDLVKIRILIDYTVIESLLGTPFLYGPISSIGGVLAISSAIALFFETNRTRAFGFLLFGGISALVVDGFRAFADGHSGFWLYPFTWWRPPSPNLYVTSDPFVLAYVILISGCIFLVDRYGRQLIESIQNK